MRTRAYRPISGAKPRLVLVLLLAAASAAAAEPQRCAAQAPDGAIRPLALATSKPALATSKPTPAAGKPRIGRIFFSPAERRSRHGGIAAASAAPIGSGRAQHDRRVVNGALRSGTAGRAVWVDGAAVENSAPDKSAWTDRNGNVWLMNGTEGTHLLKPGQSIDRNGVIEDLLPPGAVARR